jgi:hypothetical protein
MLTSTMAAPKVGMLSNPGSLFPLTVAAVLWQIESNKREKLGYSRALLVRLLTNHRRLR